jgi:predicted DNA-binding WGR domain protein
MPAKPITKREQLDPKGYYAIWERPPGRGMIWVIDRSYSGVFFRDNWDDFQRAWKRSNNDTVLVPKGADPNRMRLGTRVGFVPDELFLYEDALEKMLRFYPKWVSQSSRALVKQPDTLWILQDLNKAVQGLYMSIVAVENLMRRDKNDRLLAYIPDAERILKAAKREARKVDTAADFFRDGNPSEGFDPITTHLLAYVKALKPFYRSVGMTPAKVAAKWKGKLPKGWTDESVKKFWGSLTSRAPKHKVTECIKKMKDTAITDPGAFCASLADREIPGWREEAAKERAKKGTAMTDPLLLKVAKLAYENPELRPALMPIIHEARRKTARPIELRVADFMLYMIDPRTNTSKFYEMAVVPAGDESRAQRDKDFSGGRPAYVLMKRWGRLKDSGQPGRVDSENDYFDNEREAIAEMRAHAAKKTRKGYQDVTRQGEYPIGLGAAGFGWGGQAACRVVPELDWLRGAVKEALNEFRYADRQLAPIADIDSSMAKKLRAMITTATTDLNKISVYLDQQLQACR